MGNPFFNFKQFSIRQEHCAMKVCTDASIFGAWVASKCNNAQSVLDIGTGTGLLMLMLAQKTTAHIHGIEIDSLCEVDLKQNINSSPWAHRLSLTHGDARSTKFPSKFDLIVSNPPFFDNDLKSRADQRNIAMHGTHLSFEQLLQITIANSNERGFLAVLLPFSRKDVFAQLATEKGFSLKESLLIRESHRHPYFRTCDWYKINSEREREKVESGIQNELTIRDEKGNYTPEFTELLKDYYLYL